MTHKLARKKCAIILMYNFDVHKHQQQGIRGGHQPAFNPLSGMSAAHGQDN